MPNDREYEEILSELAEEFRLNKNVVRYIINAYYREVRDIIREGDMNDYRSLKGIYIPRFGKLRVKSRQRVDYIRSMKKEKKYV